MLLDSRRKPERLSAAVGWLPSLLDGLRYLPTYLPYLSLAFEELEAVSKALIPLTKPYLSYN